MFVGLAYLVGIPVIAVMMVAPATPSVGVLPLPATAQVEPTWGQKAEQALELTTGLSQYMSESEWYGHQRSLWTMAPDAQSQYRELVRQQVMERAKSRSASSAIQG
jgi:hypothetical protein